MATMFVRHTVADYATWRQTYDSLAPMQRELGVIGQSVYQAIDDPNDVTVTHEFASPEGRQGLCPEQRAARCAPAGRRDRGAHGLVRQPVVIAAPAPAWCRRRNPHYSSPSTAVTVTSTSISGRENPATVISVLDG